MAPSLFGWRRKRQSGPIRKEARLNLEQFNDRSMLGSMWSLRPSALLVGGGLLNRWFNPIDAAGEEPVRVASADVPPGWDSISPWWAAEPEDRPNDGLDTISLVSASPPPADTSPTTQLPSAASAEEPGSGDNTDDLGDGWSPDQDRSALITGLSLAGGTGISGVDGISSGGTQAAGSTGGASPGTGPLASAAGPAITALAPPSSAGRGVTAPTASSPGATNPGTTPSAAPPGMAGATNIQPPDVAGQMQDLLHQARQLDHSLSGKDGGSFRSQLDHLGGSSDFLGNLVRSFHQDAGISTLGHEKSPAGGKVLALVDVSPATLKGQGIFAQGTPHLAAQLADLAGVKRPGSSLPGSENPGELPPNDPSLHEVDSSSFSLHETGSNATASFTLDETITLNTTLDAQWTDTPYGSWTLDDSGTITYHFVETGSVNVDESGTNTFSNHATDATATDPKTAAFDLDSYNQNHFWPGITWGTTVADVSDGQETVTVHEVGNDHTDTGALTFTADDMASAGFSGDDPSAGNATFTEHLGGNDCFSFHAVGTDTDSSGTTQGLTVDDTSLDSFHDDGGGLVSGTDSFTEHEDGPETVTIHEFGTSGTGNNLVDFTIDDTTSDGFTDDDHSTNEPSGMVDSESATDDASGTDSFGVTLTETQVVAGIPLPTTVTDSSRDGFNFDDLGTHNPGPGNDSDHMVDTDGGAETFIIHQAGTGTLPDGTTLHLTIDDHSSDGYSEGDNVNATDLDDTTGTDSITDWDGGSDTFSVHLTGSSPQDSGGFNTSYTIDNSAADSFSTNDSALDVLGSADIPDTFTDDVHGADTITVHGTRTSSDDLGNTLNYTVDDLTSDSFRSDGSGSAEISSDGSVAGSEAYDSSVSGPSATFTVTEPTGPGSGLVAMLLSGGTDSFSIQETGTTVDGAANVSFTIADHSYDRFTDHERGTEDLVSQDASDTFIDHAFGTDSLTAHEQGTSSDASGNTINFTIDDNSADRFTRDDDGADGPQSTEDLSVDTKGNDSFSLQDSGLTHDGATTANFTGTDQSSDRFTIDDHAATDDSTDHLDDQANGMDTTSVHETGSLPESGGSLSFTLDDNADDNYNADDMATNPLGSPGVGTDTFTDTDHGNATLSLHEPGRTHDADGNLVSFTFDQGGSGNFHDGLREITAGGVLASALHSYTSDDAGMDTYSAHDQGPHGNGTITWDETAYDSFSNDEVRGDDGTDTLTHDAFGLVSYTLYQVTPATLYQIPGAITTDENSLDSYSDHDVTSDSGDGLTHTESHIHDDFGKLSHHDHSTADTVYDAFNSFHYTHDETSFDSFSVHDETSTTTVDGTVTAHQHTGTDDEHLDVSLSEDRVFVGGSASVQEVDTTHIGLDQHVTRHQTRFDDDTTDESEDQTGSSTSVYDRALNGPSYSETSHEEATATYSYHESDLAAGELRYVDDVVFDAYYHDHSRQGSTYDGTTTLSLFHTDTTVHETGSGESFALDVQGVQGTDDAHERSGHVTATLMEPTGPDEVGAPSDGQIAFTFAAGTVAPTDLFVPDPPPPRGLNNGEPTSWWSHLTDDLVDKFVTGLDHATGGVSTNILSSQAFGQVLDKTDQFFAGYADSLTAGLSTRARGRMYGAAATKNHHGAIFEAGKAVGTVHSVALSFGNPCAAPAIGKYGLKAINAVEAIGNSANAVDHVQQGDFGAAALDVLGATGNVGTLLKKCLAAGTPLLTPTGDRRVEEFKAGDLILSRSEFDPDGPLEVGRVEEVFVRTGSIFHLQVRGQVVRTTAEHPFYVVEKGWITAGELKVGDRLSSHDGRWVSVEALHETGAYETVYNLRVADYHTYFVGSRAWGFSVWAHNADYTSQLSIKNPNRTLRRNLGGSGGVAHHIIPLEFRTHDVIKAAARGGFNINGKVNGIRLSTAVHTVGSNHPTYRAAIEKVLDRLAKLNLNDTQAANALEKLADTVGRRLAQRVRPLI